MYIYENIFKQKTITSVSKLNETSLKSKILEKLLVQYEKKRKISV